MAAYLIPLAFFGGIGWPEILIILLVILLLFGGRKLPELARGLGKGLREFKDAVSGAKDELERATDLDAEPREPERTAKPDQAAKPEEKAPEPQENGETSEHKSST